MNEGNETPPENSSTWVFNLSSKILKKKKPRAGSMSTLLIDLDEQNTEDDTSLASLHKERLLAILSAFFSLDGNDYRYESLFDDYEMAAESGSTESYNDLLQNLHKSSLTFDEFSVVRTDGSKGKSFYVQFHDKENSADDKNGKTSQRLDSYIDLVLKNENLVDEIDKMRHDVTVFKSLVQFEHSELQKKYDDLHDKYNANQTNQLDTYSSLYKEIAALKFEIFRKPKKEEPNILAMPEDSFSFILLGPFGLPGLSAMLIFCAQMTTYFLSVSESFLLNIDSDFAKVPILNIPVGVTRVVHAGQGIAICFIFLVNDGLWESSMQVLNGYDKDLADHNISLQLWFASNLMRFTEGVGASIVLFILIVKSDNVVELFKDFTAMTFISSLDNIFFFLAKMDVIGTRFKDATEITEITVQDKIAVSLTGKKRLVMHPATINGIWMLFMFSVWLFIGVIPQIRGDYLCQSIYFQFNDHVNPKLSFFSGVYELEKGGDKKGWFITSYVENKNKFHENRKPMIVRFCPDKQNWIFTFKDYDKNECSKGRFIESTTVNDQQQFDLFNVPKDEWVVNSAIPVHIDDINEEDRFMPLIDMYMTCVDKDKDVLTLPSHVCPKIEVDIRDQYTQFIGTKTWSSSFDLLTNTDNTTVQVYNRPVYYRELNETEEIELVFFTGKRWTIASSLNFYTGNYPIGNYTENVDLSTDKKHDLDKLRNFLTNDFHAYYSMYFSAFFSEPVTLDTPEDSFLPVDLGWYSSTLEGNPVVDLKRPVQSMFICSECNQEGNKCFYENTCIDGKCKCQNGASGTLCQVLPTNNGRCDDFFNSQEFDFDGGDCCMNTCVSKGNNICALDPTASFYIGFDLCKTSFFAKDLESSISIGEVPPSRNDISEVSQVSLSSNGRILASIDAKTLSVSLYDSSGSRWKIRGAAVATVENPFSDSVEVSSNVEFLNTIQGQLSPVTVAVKIGGEMSIFDWNKNMWENHSDGLQNNNSTKAKETQLRNDGKVLGVLYDNRTFILYHRSFNARSWDVKEHVDGKYDFAAMSYDGETYVLANETTLVAHKNHIKYEFDDLNQSDKIKGVSISPNGNYIALLIEFQPNNSKLSLLHFKSGLLKQRYNSLRGLDSSGITVSTFDIGSRIAVHSVTDKKITIYSLVEGQDENTIWKIINEIPGERMTFSMDQTALAVIPEFAGDTSYLAVYQSFTLCPNDHSKAHLTFNLDSSKRSLIWEVIHLRTLNDFTVLAKGGPYYVGDISVTQEFCLPNGIIEDKYRSDCVFIKISDLELDGLRSPGSIGITVNGEVKWNETRTDGFRDIFSVFGNETCRGDFLKSSPWGNLKYDTTLRVECRMKQCEWSRSGEAINAYSNFGIFTDEVFQISRPLSMSSDGSVIAFNNDTNSVDVLVYDSQNGWTNRGPTIKGNGTHNFGYSKSLSADGETLAIGAPHSNSSGDNSGQVFIFSYDPMNSEWVLYGNVINGTAGSLLGYSVKLSADGTAVVLSTGLHHPSCHVYVYAFDENKRSWIQRGRCIDALLGRSTIDSQFYVEISSNGWFVAIGAPLSSAFGNEDASGHVVSYQFNEVLEKWELRGDLIASPSPYNLFGASVSLSANGDILAIGCVVNGYVVTYQYSSDRNAWDQLGTTIETRSEATIGYVEVALASDGFGLTISTSHMFFTYGYDDGTSSWIQNNVVSPELQNIDYTPIVTSADGMTIIVGSRQGGNQVNVYRLQASTTEDVCDDDKYKVNFTLSPDMFPKDLVWAIHDQSGASMVGGFIPETNVGESRPQFFYNQCLPKSNKYYTFSLYDLYGDGICCEWGKGNYMLTLDSKVVSTSENFRDVAYVCLPKSGDLQPLIVKIGDSDKRNVHWNLFDTGSNLLAERSTVIDPLTYGICQKAEYCYTFAVRNPTGNDLDIQISFGNETQQNISKEPLEVRKIGNCTDDPSTRACSSGSNRFVLDIFTDISPSESYWALVDSNGTIVVSSKNETFFVTRFSRFSQCLSEEHHECLTLVMLDSWGDSGPSYSVSWGDNQTFVGQTLTSIEKVFLDNSTECSRTLQCPDGFALFEIEFKALQTTNVSWFEVQNEKNVTFVQGKEETILNEYLRQTACLPLVNSSSSENKCWTFRRVNDPNEPAEMITEVYQATWNGQIIQKRSDGGFESPLGTEFGQLSFGQCSS